MIPEIKENVSKIITTEEMVIVITESGKVYSNIKLDVTTVVKGIENGFKVLKWTTFECQIVDNLPKFLPYYLKNL